jgi:Fic-DOC domain mobile mystery protein B
MRVTSFEFPEGATSLSPEDVEELRIPGIKLREQLNIWEERNILAARGWARTTRRRDAFSEAFILSLHQHMFGDVWGWAGRFRSTNTNLGVLHWHIGAEIRKMCDDARLWIAPGGYAPDEAAARLHHRLVFIHPFVNGNGRHARLWADFILVRMLGQPGFTWGGRDLAPEGVIRDRYIAALKSADSRDFGPLLEFVRS